MYNFANFNLSILKIWENSRQTHSVYTCGKEKNNYLVPKMGIQYYFLSCQYNLQNNLRRPVRISSPYLWQCSTVKSSFENDILILIPTQFLPIQFLDVLKSEENKLGSEL